MSPKARERTHLPEYPGPATLKALVDKRCRLSSRLCSAAAVQLPKHTGQWLLHGEGQFVLHQLLRKGVVNITKLVQLKMLLKLFLTKRASSFNRGASMAQGPMNLCLATDWL